MIPVSRTHSFLLCLALTAAAVLLPLSPAAAQPDPEPSASRVADSRLVLDGTSYSSWHAFLRDRALDPEDRRCGTPEPEMRRVLYPAPDGAELPPPLPGVATAADCSAGSTNPSSDYDTTFRWVIPVVVHNLLTSDCGTGYLSDSNVQGQIDILNEDFQAILGSNGENGNNLEIHFELATVDPDGSPTSGINRICDTSWYQDGDAYYDFLAWDPDRYLNIYTNNAGGFLGYVPFLPADAGGAFVGNNTDRVVILHTAFGPDAPLVPYNLGRTATHEVGHYLGLEHTFHGACGTQSSPGCYASGDLICDTNGESEPYLGCAGPRSTCGTPDPYTNYMNYADDPCMEEFTVEQGRRMRCSLQHYRPDLGTMEPIAAGLIFTDGFESGDVSVWSKASP